MRETLLTKMIRIYGFEHSATIEFATLCENQNISEYALVEIVKAHEENPKGEE